MVRIRVARKQPAIWQSSQRAFLLGFFKKEGF